MFSKLSSIDILFIVLVGAWFIVFFSVLVAQPQLTEKVLVAGGIAGGGYLFIRFIMAPFFHDDFIK